MGKLDLWLQILNLQGKTTRAISFRRRSNFRASGQLDLQVKTILNEAIFFFFRTLMTICKQFVLIHLTKKNLNLLVFNRQKTLFGKKELIQYFFDLFSHYRRKF